MARSSWRAAIGVFASAAVAGVAWWAAKPDEPVEPVEPARALGAAPAPARAGAPTKRVEPPAAAAAPEGTRPAASTAAAVTAPVALAPQRAQDLAQRTESARRTRERLLAQAKRWQAATGPSAARTGGERPVLDFDYASSRIEEHFIPLAKDCYGALLEKQPGASGEAVFAFEIVGDESIGGVIDSVELTEESTLDEPEFVECVRESLLSVEFEPPPTHGRATIVYRTQFAPPGAPPTTDP